MLLDTDIYCAQVLGEIIPVSFRVLAQIQNYFVVPNSTCYQNSFDQAKYHLLNIGLSVNFC